VSAAASAAESAPASAKRNNCQSSVIHTTFGPHCKTKVIYQRRGRRRGRRRHGRGRRRETRARIRVDRVVVAARTGDARRAIDAEAGADLIRVGLTPLALERRRLHQVGTLFTRAVVEALRGGRRRRCGRRSWRRRLRRRQWRRRRRCWHRHRLMVRVV
jgi:hypothetical protein